MEFSRQENWSGVPFLSSRDLLNPGIEPWSPALQADSLLSEQPGKSHQSLYTHANTFLVIAWLNCRVSLFSSVQLLSRG